jgi:hypothetical protein
MSILDDLAASAVNAPVTGLQQSPVGTGESGGFFNNLLTGIGNLPLSGLAQTGLSYAALDDVMDRLSSVGSGLATGAQRIGEEAAAGTAFRPFTVSTGFGGITTTPEGGFTTSLSPAQAAQQQQLQAITSGLLGGMGGMGGGVAPNRFSYGPVRPPMQQEQPTVQFGAAPPTGSLQQSIQPPIDVMRQPGEGQGYAKGPVAGGPAPLPPMTAFQTFMSPEEAMAARISGAQPLQAGLSPAQRFQRLPQASNDTGPASFEDLLTGEIVSEEQMQAMQPPQAPMAPSTGGFGSGIPDVSGITGQALGGLSGALTGLMAPMGQREADVYERIRATQRPEEERARLALEERLQSQGRTGLRTAQFGGAPEQLALAQAQEEAKNRAALSALGQAQAEQQQQLGLAQGLFGLGSGAAALPASLQLGQLQNIGLAQAAQYLPEQQLLTSLTPAINLANIAGTGQRQGAGYLAEAGISGLESQAQTELARANLLGQIYSSMLGAAGATGAAEAGAGSTNDLIGSIFGGETLGGLFSSIFN